MTEDSSPKEGQEIETAAERLLARAQRLTETRARLIERWARAETWDLVEGIALAWTIDPSTLGGSFEYSSSRLPADAKHYLEMARRSRELIPKRVAPGKFVSWAHRFGLAFHRDWHDAIAKAASDMQQVRKSPAEKDAARRKQLISRWARAPYWDPEEGVVLAMNQDPNETITRSVTGYDDASIRGSADAQHLLKLARRAINVGALAEEAAPIKFMTWARSMRVEFHADWWDAVGNDGDTNAAQQPAETPAVAPVPDLGTRERMSLLKLVTGMAIRGYSWDPAATRSKAVSEIADDLKQLGIPLDEGTIRKWLREGVDHLPREDG